MNVLTNIETPKVLVDFTGYRGNVWHPYLGEKGIQASSDALRVLITIHQPSWGVQKFILVQAENKPFLLEDAVTVAKGRGLLPASAEGLLNFFSQEEVREKYFADTNTMVRRLSTLWVFCSEATNGMILNLHGQESHKIAAGGWKENEYLPAGAQLLFVVKE